MHTIFQSDDLMEVYKGFRGFFDFNGDGVKEAFFGDNLIIEQNGASNYPLGNFEVYMIRDLNKDGSYELLGYNTSGRVEVWGAESSTSVAEDNFVAKGFQLFQNYPNPFNPITAIRYNLPTNSEVRLSIFNTTGQLVRTLVDNTQSAGMHTVVWDGRDEMGQAVSSGVYLYRLQDGDRLLNRKLMLIK